MNLVTISCKRDLNHLLLQIHSIEKFVKGPVTLYIILEDDFDLKVNTHLDIRIIKPNLKSNLHGWYRQQILKLKAVEYVNDDYMLLDSKNFFIKDTDLDYSFIEGSCYLLEDANWTKPFVDKITIPYEPITYYYTQHTPFKVRKSVIDNILDKIDISSLYDACADDGIYPSEFSLYSLFSDLRPTFDTWQHKPIYYTWWWSDELDPDQFDSIYNSTVEILGLHKNVWYHNSNNIRKLADWLISKGLSENYVYPATVNMDWGKTYLQDRSPTL